MDEAEDWEEDAESVQEAEKRQDCQLDDDKQPPQPGKTKIIGNNRAKPRWRGIGLIV